MAWVRAVWREREMEEEAVVPLTWIQDGMVLWPRGPNALKLLKQRKVPGKTWMSFPLVKVKHASGIHFIYCD